jgi:hypothetical protein
MLLVFRRLSGPRKHYTSASKCHRGITSCQFLQKRQRILLQSRISGHSVFPGIWIYSIKESPWQKTLLLSVFGSLPSDRAIYAMYLRAHTWLRLRAVTTGSKVLLDTSAYQFPISVSLFPYPFLLLINFLLSYTSHTRNDYMEYSMTVNKESISFLQTSFSDNYKKYFLFSQHSPSDFDNF